jgi:hypothetical protein
MNNNINIAELLKGCPKGTKLYSTIFGEVELKEVKDNGRSVCIFVTNFYGQEEMFYPDGKYNTHYSDSECTLFPSKEQRDWSKFCPFKDGDVIYVRTRRSDWVSIFKNDTKHQMLTYTDYNLDNNNFYGSDKEAMALCQKHEILEKRIATEEEKEKLFKVIKDNGYKWNEETKTLEKENDETDE